MHSSLTRVEITKLEIKQLSKRIIYEIAWNIVLRQSTSGPKPFEISVETSRTLVVNYFDVAEAVHEV